MDYTSNKVDQLQKQYEMLMKSIVFSSADEKENIYYQLNKIVESILSNTESLYNQEYDKLMNEKTSLLKEEKERLVKLIELIENRRRYVMDVVDGHRRNVDVNYEMPNIKGVDKIGEYQRKIKIIDKYSQNIRLKNKLIKEVDDLADKLNKSEVKIRANDRINKELEEKMKDMLEKSFKAMEIYSYKEREEEIELAFNELSFAKDKAVQNINTARKTNNSVLLVECEKMYDSVEEEYRKYYEKKMLLKLLYMYDRVVNNYEELFAKREEINEILSQIDSSDFYKLVFNEINKQYNTIKLEQQDVRTYNSLLEEKETKENLLKEIEKENNSEEFIRVLNELLKNEKIKQEKEEQIRRKEEYEERQKKLIEESKKQEEIRKKQKKIEEERKRDIEIRTREMLEKQRTGIIPKVEVKEKRVEREKFVDSILNEMEQEKNKEKVDVPEFFPVNNKVKEVKQDEKKEVKEEKNDSLEFFPVNDNIKEAKQDVKVKVKDEKKDALEFFPVKNNIKDVKQDVKVEEKEVKKENNYDEILQSSDEFNIPIIKNDNLVAKKVEEKVQKNDVDEFMKRFLEDSKKEEVNDVNDMVFPDMPM